MIVFLDVDGVIATTKSYKEQDDMLDRDCIEVLNLLTDALDAKIVVSSTWRCEGYRNIQKKLNGAGVRAEIIGITPRLINEPEEGSVIHVAEGRGNEILKWIKDNNYEGEYLVLDDEISDIKNAIPADNILHIKDGWFKGALTHDILENFFNKDNQWLKIR